MGGYPKMVFFKHLEPDGGQHLMVSMSKQTEYLNTYQTIQNIHVSTLEKNEHFSPSKNFFSAAETVAATDVSNLEYPKRLEQLIK